MLQLSIVICCLAVCIATGRIPFYDLERVIYPNPYNFLQGIPSSEQSVNGIESPVEVPGWGADIPMGQVVGVTIGKDGNPVVLHRASRKWTLRSFNSSDHFLLNDPIKEDVIVTLDAATGKTIKTSGRGMFYLPHGITIDNAGNLWITDVGLHQVLKYAQNSEAPSLILGEKLVPGKDFTHFCKPTSVAVASSGEFFVADGYCNNRILKFSPDGVVKGQFGTSDSRGQPGGLSLPHGLALNEELEALCIADRENARVVCVNAGLKNSDHFGKSKNEIYQQYQSKVFDVAFYGEYLLGVAGSGNEAIAIGFTADIMEGVLSLWEPLQMFHNPHAIATDPQRNSIYVTEIGPNRIWKFALHKQTSI